MEYKSNRLDSAAPLRLVGKVNEIVLGRFNVWAWWGLAALSYGVSRLAQTWLDASYVRSEFPVPFMVGQTTFSGARIKEYYQHMIDQGTLGIYVQTQLIDYVFMATVFLSFLCLGAAALRTIPSAWREGKILKVGLFFMWLAPMAAVADALENAVSFVMLADPQGFADWLAYPYSSFAVIKFALFSIGYLWAICSIFMRIAYWVSQGFARLSRLRPSF